MCFWAAGCKLSSEYQSVMLEVLEEEHLLDRMKVSAMEDVLHDREVRFGEALLKEAQKLIAESKMIRKEFSQDSLIIRNNTVLRPLWKQDGLSAVEGDFVWLEFNYYRNHQCTTGINRRTDQLSVASPQQRLAVHRRQLRQSLLHCTDQQRVSNRARQVQ